MIEEEEIAVYLQGDAPMGYAFYRIVLKTGRRCSTRDRLRRKVEGKRIIPPVAVLSQKDYGCCGGWTVIGDDIYWAGSWSYGQTVQIILSDKLFKHNIHQPDPSYWETVTTLKIPRATPFLAPIGTSKLAIVSGADYSRKHRPSIFDDEDYEDEDEDDDAAAAAAVIAYNWTRCGEIYDLDNKTSEFLTADIKLLKPYDTFHATTPVAEDQDPTQVVFSSISDGSMLILDASTGSILEQKDKDPSFSSLEAISSHDSLDVQDHQSIEPLHFTVNNSPPVFHKRTFYWFTYGLKLYGYDMDLQRWLRSNCLQRQLHPLRAIHASGNEYPLTPLLIGLPNGKFLVIVTQRHGEFTMASLRVHKDVVTFTLVVKVDHIQYFRPCDPNFTPHLGKAIRLKNTGSGTMRG